MLAQGRADDTRAILVPMRRWLLVAGSFLVVIALAIGVAQTGGDDQESAPDLYSPAQARAKLKGAPPRLAAIHSQANDLLEGGEKAYDRRVDELRGLPVVVNKWGSWCNPCREEFPMFNRLSADLGRRVAFLGVDSADPRDHAERFLQRMPVSYPSYVDADGALATKLGGQNFPATIFYDRRGRETIHQGPYRSIADLQADIRRYALTG